MSGLTLHTTDFVGLKWYKRGTSYFGANDYGHDCYAIDKDGEYWTLFLLHSGFSFTQIDLPNRRISYLMRVAELDVIRRE